ncbi:hypothetical protein PHISCL_04707 [Aspergillus sclerotialis]|uniref:galacturonan 1,4-alpha-galacturonidase n=1 Tax=Aspergillus sclerotialis TaxID=2070753 RepID=A0A3A2ZIF6_9EURO|nr:hypothetical protein PHISCL_04707 [Aspergillus sclerotialis]
MLFPKSSLAFLLSLSLLVSCAPNSRHHRCVVPSKYKSSNGEADDSPAISEALAKCSTNSVIVFEDGVDYNVFQPISARNLSNVKIQMDGTLHLPQDIPSTQEIVKAGTSYWFTLEGPMIDYIGSSDSNKGWINSYGQKWWDANPPNETGLDNRPKLISLNTEHGIMKYFKARKPISHTVKLNGDDIVVSHAFIDAYSTGGFPFNTDGFGVDGTNIRVTDSVIYNGDDAIAVHNGAKNIVFERNTIGYQTHGMSIGSLGKDPEKFENLSNIRFEDNTVISGLYAARFKSWRNGNGLVKNVSWKNIRVFNVSFPIFVTQTYYDQDTSTPGSGADSAVMMEDFTFEDFAGTVNTYQHGDGSCASDPCWYDEGLPNLNYTETVIIECAMKDSCKGFSVKNINVVPQSLEKPTVICMNATADLNPDLGIECKNGTYSPLGN